MAEVPLRRAHTFQDEIADTTTAGRRKQSQTQRQLLSCTKCRERKVKVGILWMPTPYELTHDSAIVQNHVRRVALVAFLATATS